MFSLRSDAAIERLCHKKAIAVAGGTSKDLDCATAASVGGVSSLAAHAKRGGQTVTYLCCDRGDFSKKVNVYAAHNLLNVIIYPDSCTPHVTIVFTTPLRSVTVNDWQRHLFIAKHT